MKRILIAFVFPALAYAQYAASASHSPTAAAEINSKPAFQVASGAPSNCTAGEDFWFNSSTLAMNQCSATNTWSIITGTIASGTVSLGTTAVSSGACSSAITATATGTATTDVIVATANADPTGVTGYTPATSGTLYVWAYPTSNTVNFKVCNNTASSITPGSAVTLNWKVVR